MAEAEVLEISTHDHVRVLRLNRPERKNALNSRLGWSIVQAIEDAARDEDVWVIGITGAGDAFCSGLDLGPEDSSERTNPLSRQDDAIDELGWVGRFPVLMREQCDKPIVAGLNGVAVGAGLSLAMATDIRLASSSARLMAGYARMGTSPDGGLTWTLAQLIGYERALRFLLEMPMMPAAEALELGLVGEVVDAARFEERFSEYLAQIAALPPIAVRQTKRILHRASAPPDVRAHAAYELINARRGLASEDGAEARQAFMERRPAHYRGR